MSVLDLNRRSISIAWIATALSVIAYYIATVWLVSFGSVISPALLTAQLATYSVFAMGSAIILKGLGCRSPWGSRSETAWVARISMISAVAALIARFALKQPPAEWALRSPQDWRDISDGYLVGRMLVPLAEELVFRGVLFCPSERAGFSKPLTVVTTATIFAALHWAPLYGLPATGGMIDVTSALAAGLAFGTLRAWTGSILPGLGLHILGNSIGF